MIQELFNKNIFIYVMIALCASGILLKMILDIVYSHLIKASDNMATSKNKLTQTMKMKFETCYKLKIGVNNVDIFVDKYVFRHKFCGILLSTWENICGQILMLCLLIGSISTIIGLIYECGKQQILSTFSVGILTSGLLIFLEGLINLSGKKELIRLTMKDYLENILKVRLEQELTQPELIEQYKRDYLSQEVGQALNSSVYLAATTEKAGRLSRKEKKDKLAYGKFEKMKRKRQQKEAIRLDKENRKAEKKAAALKKVENKKFEKEMKQKERQEKRRRVREEAERIKQEAKLEIERKKEAERVEVQRIRAEVKAEEERKKEEKSRGEEIKKALTIEKQAVKEEKKRMQSSEHKTLAQEKKENLLREVQGRRSIEPKEKEERELEDEPKENIAAIVIEENPKIQKLERVNLQRANQQVVKQQPANQQVIKQQVARKQEEEEKPVITAEISKPIHNKKSKQSVVSEEKLIEDILKEFLA